MTGLEGQPGLSKINLFYYPIHCLGFRWVLLFELPGGEYGFLLPSRYIKSVRDQYLERKFSFLCFFRLGPTLWLGLRPWLIIFLPVDLSYHSQM